MTLTRLLAIALLSLLMSAGLFAQTISRRVAIETSLGTIVVGLYDETPVHRDNFLKLASQGYYDGVLFHRVIAGFMIQAGDPNSRNAPKERLLGDGGPDYTLPAEFSDSLIHKRGALAAAREGDASNPQRRSSGSQFYIVWGRKFSFNQLGNMLKRWHQQRCQALFDSLTRAHDDDFKRLLSNADSAAVNQLAFSLSQQVQQRYPQPDRFSKKQQVAYTQIGGSPHLDGAYTVFGEVLQGLEIVEKIQASPVDGNNRPLDDVVISKVSCL